MECTERGKVRDARTIVLDEPLSLPSGTEVEVRIFVSEPEETLAERPERASEDLPAFGMWADREDMKDSVEWVRQQRRKRRYENLWD